MAKYGINKEGVDALNQLANDLGSINKDIEDDGKKLKTTVSSLGDNLGIYEDQILELIENEQLLNRKALIIDKAERACYDTCRTTAEEKE